MKIYLAGPLFTLAERDFNVRLANGLLKEGFEVWLPQNEEPRELTPRSIFLRDKQGIDWADTILAIMDGPDPDSGTCWEVGYGYARDKRIILLRTDFRVGNEGKLGVPYNLMLAESADARFETPFISLDNVLKILVEYLKKF